MYNIVMNVSGRTQEQKSQQAKDLASIVRDPAAQGESDFVPEYDKDNRFDHAYGRLGEDLYIGFAQQANASGNERLIELASRYNVLNGLYIMTRLLSYAPSAYVEYTKARPVAEQSLDELGQIMQASRSVLKPFADRDIKGSQTYEIHFGLQQYPPMYSDVPPFLIEENEAGDVQLQASPTILRRAGIETIQRGIPTLDPSKIYCPAVGMVMNSLWSAAVTECVERPELFPADLAKLSFETTDSRISA